MSLARVPRVADWPQKYGSENHKTGVLSTNVPHTSDVPFKPT